MARRRGGDRGGPFLKWAGGKGALLEAYEPLYPPRFADYHEPFVGAGAVYFRLASTGRIVRAHLSDRNEALTLTYEAVKHQVPRLVEVLRRLREAHDEASYYRERERFNRGGLDPVERAALVIYLNKTGYNGLYRVNAKGAFNVPFGRYRNPAIPQEAELRAAARLLSPASIETRDFASVLERARPGDFVYLDPPYDPLDRTSSFTGYAAGGFPRAEQERLAETFRRLDRKGVLVMLSNHATPLMRRLYAGYFIGELVVKRAINSVASRRSTPVVELVVRNYGE